MINNNILRAVLESMSKEQKEQLIAELIAEVGNLQPQEPTEEGVEKLKNIVASNADGGDLQIVDTSLVDKIQPLKKMDFSTNWGKGVEGKRPVRAQGNAWQDTGEGRDPDYDPSKYEAMGRKARPTQDRVNKIKKQCSVCGKEVEVAAGLVYGKFYRCDRCT